MNQDIESLQKWREIENYKLESRIKMNRKVGEWIEIEENKEQEKKSEEVKYWLKIQEENVTLEKKIHNIFSQKVEQNNFIDKFLEKTN